MADEDFGKRDGVDRGHAFGGADASDRGLWRPCSGEDREREPGGQR
jgi:hypothetical protein